MTDPNAQTTMTTMNLTNQLICVNLNDNNSRDHVLLLRKPAVAEKCTVRSLGIHASQHANV